MPNPSDAYDAVIFDLDGTLVDSMILYFECYRRALEPALGRRVSAEELMAMKPRSELRLLHQLATDEGRAETLESFYRHYEALHDEFYGGFYPGVRQMVAALRAAGLGLGVVTGKSRRAWDITCAVDPLGEWDVVVVDDDVRAPKPDPHGLELALEAMGVVAARALYVGDTGGDLGAARAAGMKGGAALWSKSGPDRDAFAARADAFGALCFETPSAVARLVLGRSDT